MRKSIELNPKDAFPYFNLGLLYMEFCAKKMGDYKDSAKNNFNLSLKYITKQDGEFKKARIYLNIGMLFRDYYHLKDSSRIFIYKSIYINKNMKEAHSNLGQLYQIYFAPNNSKYYDSAKNQYLKEIEINPNDAPSYNNLGTLYKDYYNDPFKAKQNYLKSIEVDSNNALSYNNLGLIFNNV